MSILTGSAIKQAIKDGSIRIQPFNENQLNPNSYDLRLGENVYCYTEFVLDPKKNNNCTYLEIPEYGLILYPNIGYLMHTKEQIWSNKYVPIINGKSSIGRLFVSIHVTAGMGDIGFDGQYTLEVFCVQKVRLYPGMRIAQVLFETVEGEITQYSGNYQKENASGPVPSRSWKQFEDDYYFIGEK